MNNKITKERGWEDPNWVGNILLIKKQQGGELKYPKQYFFFKKERAMKCKDHIELDTISWEEFQEMLIEEGWNQDYVCDVCYQDLGFEYCEECERMVQVE